jgi:CBS domain-containing protein
MIARALISNEIPPLKLTDNGERVLNWMDEFKVAELPLIDGKKYLGLVEEYHIIDANDVKQQLGELHLKLDRPFVLEHQHLFDVIITLAKYDVDVVAVLNANDEYLGVISSRDIIKHLAQTVSIENAGSIVTLEMNTKDYSMVEIAKIVESDNAKILSSFVSSNVDSTKLEVTLKINKSDISRILHTFDRFNYKVTASYQESEYIEDLKKRYDEFMRYLNI